MWRDPREFDIKVLLIWFDKHGRCLKQLFLMFFFVDSNGNDIIFNWLTAFFHFLQGNPGWGLLPTSNPWFTRVITVFYPWYNRDLYPKPWFGTDSVQNRDFLQPMIYPWYNHDLPVIARVLKHGFEPPNCVDFFHTSLSHFTWRKTWMRGKVGPLRSGSPVERAEHIGPLLQHTSWIF